MRRGLSMTSSTRLIASGSTLDMMMQAALQALLLINGVINFFYGWPTSTEITKI